MVRKTRLWLHLQADLTDGERTAVAEKYCRRLKTARSCTQKLEIDMRAMIVPFAAFLVLGCAQSPDSIAPAFVSDVPYQSYTCEQLGEEQLRLTEALTQASQQQQQARSNDVAGVILLGLPLGSMSGQNVAPLIAQYRGQLDAIRRAGIRRNCGLPQPPAAPARAATPPAT
jgi:hypothetical protein